MRFMTQVFRRTVTTIRILFISCKKYPVVELFSIFAAL